LAAVTKIMLRKEAYNEYHGEYSVIGSDQKLDAEHEYQMLLYPTYILAS
jgi:hypothetical protein